MSATQSRAGQVLDLVRARSASAEAEVTARSGVAALTRFANSAIHQNVAEELNHLVLRVALDGHVATVSFDGRPGPDRLQRIVDDAFETALARPVDPDWPGLTPPTPPGAIDHWDDGTGRANPDDRARVVAAFVAALDGLEGAGSCSTEATTADYANSAGHAATGRSTIASLDGIARTARSDGSARATSVRLADLDGRQAGDRAAGKARESEAAGDLEPGRYEVVLEPKCVADVLQFLFIYGLNGRAVEEGRSFVRIGEPQFDAAITLREDAGDPGTVGLGFDTEGTPKRRVDVVSGGVTSAVLHSRRTAAKAGTESTGNAVEGGEGWGALPTNTVLDAGAATDGELIAGVGRGLLVTDFWYTRILDPRTQVVTGLTRNGLWLIEDGRIVRPVSNLRFTKSYLEALGPGAVRAIGRERALIPGSFDGFFLVPSLHLASWNFTGGAKG
jgi:predicted Zn-dependent protease